MEDEDVAVVVEVVDLEELVVTGGAEVLLLLQLDWTTGVL